MRLRTILAATLFATLSTTPWVGGTEEIEGTVAADPSTGGHDLSWWGEIGMTYFIQYSDNLEDWLYIPDLASGSDAEITYHFTGYNLRGFYKIRGTDYPTSNPQGDDFDGDGVSNLDELNSALDPLAALDWDLNNVPDDWEAFYDADGDGLVDLVETMVFGTDPELADTDGDGVSDVEDPKPLDAGSQSFVPGSTTDTTAPTIVLTSPVGATQN